MITPLDISYLHVTTVPSTMMIQIATSCKVFNTTPLSVTSPSPELNIQQCL